MHSRLSYILIITVSIAGLPFLVFCKEPLIYWIYGYDLSLINDYSAESFIAIKTTAYARMLVSYYRLRDNVRLFYLFNSRGL